LKNFLYLFTNILLYSKFVFDFYVINLVINNFKNVFYSKIFINSIGKSKIFASIVILYFFNDYSKSSDFKVKSVIYFRKVNSKYFFLQLKKKQHFNRLNKKKFLLSFQNLEKKNKKEFYSTDEIKLLQLQLNLEKKINDGVQFFLKSKYLDASKNFEKVEKIITTLKPKFIKKNYFYLLDDSYCSAIGHYLNLDILYNERVLKLHNKTFIFFYKDSYFKNLKNFFKPHFLFFNYMNLFKRLILYQICKSKKFFQEDGYLIFIKKFFWWGRLNNKTLIYYRYGNEIKKLYYKKYPSGMDPSRAQLKKNYQKIFLSKFKPRNYKKHICIHVREAGYHYSWNKKNPSLRDADITTYIKGLKHLLSEGYHVFRIGDKKMSSCKISDEKFINLTKANLTLDDQLAIVSSCEFMISTNSGISYMPNLFAVPSLYTNWAPIGIFNWGYNDIYLPKKIFHKKTGKIVKLDFLLKSNLGFVQFKKQFSSKFFMENNTEEEIISAIKNMQIEIKNKTLRNFSSSNKKIHSVLRKYKAVDSGKICPNFLKKFKII
jgi:putative glycosyltransferase (TIGR04372 family)